MHDSNPLPVSNDSIEITKKINIHLLIVEDNYPALIGLKQLFKPYVATFITYNCVEDAWVQPLDPKINLIITDIGLPGASGLEFASWVNQQPSPPPVFAVSAHVDAELKQACLEVGMQDAYTKPLTSDHVKVLLSQAKLIKSNSCIDS